MQTITDLIWTLMISLQFTSFAMIVITFTAKSIKCIVRALLRDSDEKIKITINPIWWVLIIFSTFYLTHM